MILWPATWEWWETVLSPVLFTLYTSDFLYNSELCHVQKFADDSAIVGCPRSGQEEYRELIKDFVTWYDSLKKRDIACLDKLVRTTGSVVGAELDHSLHSTISRQRSSFSDRLLSLSCSTNRLRKSFLPHIIQLCTPHGESDK